MRDEGREQWKVFSGCVGSGSDSYRNAIGVV